MSYPELKGKCKFCLGCIRLENKYFRGTNDCIYGKTAIEHINIILKTGGKTNDNKNTNTMQVKEK